MYERDFHEAGPLDLAAPSRPRSGLGAIGAPVALSVLGLLLGCRGGAADEHVAEVASALQTVRATQITYVQGDTTMKSVVSDVGIASTQYDASHSPVRGTVVRYADGIVFGLDYGAHTYVTQALEVAASRKVDEAALDVPNPAPSQDPTPLGMHATIGGTHAEAYQTSQQGQRIRLWYADATIATPPSSALDQIARVAMSHSTSCACDRNQDPGRGHHHDHDDPGVHQDSEHGDDHAGGRGHAAGCDWARELGARTLLRSEVLRDGVWTKMLDTTDTRPVTVPRSTFDAPTGWTAAPPLPPSVPPEVSPVEDEEPPPTPQQPTANVTYKGGPTIQHPELYAHVWGPALDGAAVDELLRAHDVLFGSFAQPLRQYGYIGGAVERVFRIAAAPPSDIGEMVPSWAAATAYVNGQGLSGNAPAFWWTVGSHDPVYEFLVPLPDGVDAHNGSGGVVTGYHSATETFAWNLLPFPANFFAYDAMPFIIVYVHEGAMGVPLEGPQNRIGCRTALATDPYCSSLKAALVPFDQSTEAMAHEFAETVSDPMGGQWFDRGISSTPDSAEIGDICTRTGAISHTLVGFTEVATYWSQADRACVPLTTPPTLNISSPLDGVLRWQPRFRLEGDAFSPIFGGLTDKIVWYVDGATLAQRGSGVSVPLSLGIHTIEASVADDDGYPVSAGPVTVFVYALPPVPTIVSPTSGARVAAGELQLIGSAIDPQDGVDDLLSWSIDGSSPVAGASIFRLITVPGPHTAVLTAMDAAGLTASTSVTFDVVASGLLNVILTSPTAGDQHADPSIPFYFDALATGLSGIEDATWSWVDDIDGEIGTTASFWQALSGGATGVTEHHVTVTATAIDGSGRTGSITITLFSGTIG